MLALWLPAMLHCELEAAEVSFLTHDDHHSAPDHSTSADDEYHVLKEAAFTVGVPSLKVLPPADALAVAFVVLAIDTGKTAEPVLSPYRHPPPPELAVGWHFVRRAAPSPRAPSVRV